MKRLFSTIQKVRGYLIPGIILLFLLPESLYGVSERNCVVEITSAEIEKMESGGLLKLEWKLKEVLNWTEIISGDLSQPRLKDIRPAAGTRFRISLDGHEMGSSGTFNFREVLNCFSIKRGENISASVTLERNPGYRDVSVEFSRILNREPVMGKIEISARADTMYAGARKAVRRGFSDLQRVIADGGGIACLLIIILLWGLFSIYMHLRRLYSEEFENLSSASEKVNVADSMEDLQKAAENCPVLDRMDIRAGVEEYRERIRRDPESRISVRNGRELERLRARLHSGISRQLDRMLESEGRMASGIMSVEMVRCFGILAPMVGLLGTVIGISDSFQGLYLRIKTIVTGQNKTVLENLSGGIHLALNTTVFGLIVGIVFLFFYYYIQFRRSRIVITLNTALENTISKVVEEDYLLHEKETDAQENAGKNEPENQICRTAVSGGV